jgi:hypothetical protein
MDFGVEIMEIEIIEVLLYLFLSNIYVSTLFYILYYM